MEVFFEALFLLFSDHSNLLSNDTVNFPNHAFSFENENSRILIDLPEKMKELTMMCWVQIHSLGSPVNTLLQSHNNRVGYPSWFLMQDEKMWFNLERPIDNLNLKEVSFSSPPIWNRGMREVWMQLTVTVDEKNVSFFKNGRELSVMAHGLQGQDILIGLAELGNCFKQARTSGVSHSLHGLMDEYLVFNRALSKVEIQEIYEQGNIE